MHRINPVLRLSSFGSLLVGFLCFAGAQAVRAQDKPGDIPVIIMTTGGTQIYQASSKENLKSVTNTNAKVLQVSRVEKRFDTVLFEALAPGRTRVTFVDVKDKTEVVEVMVVSERVKELREMIQRAVPNSAVNVLSSDNGISVVLTGTVRSVEDAKTVQQIAGQLYGTNVVNNLQIGGVQQIQLEVLIASVNRSALRNMTFSWVENQNSWFISSILPIGSIYTFASQLATGAAGANPQSNLLGPTGVNIPFGVLTSKNGFMGFLQALRTEGLTKTLSEPRIMTMSGRPANIVSGGEVPILTSSGLGAPSVSYKEFGTVVSFLPIVLGNGKIHLEVRPEISAPDSALSLSIAGTTPTNVPAFKTQSAQVAVQMEDGQTLAIGGLIQNDVVGTIDRVPFLGDIPFLGTLFTSKSYQETEQELIILVTPRLVDPVDCTKIPKYLPGRETRGPNDFEFFLEGIQEAPRGHRDVSLHPREYKAAYLNGPSASQYPCNDISGCSRPGCGNGSCAGSNCSTCAAGAPTNTNLNVAPKVTQIPTTQPVYNTQVPGEMGMPLPGASTSRGGNPILAPAVPATPTIPSSPERDLDNRGLLPPASFGRPAGS